ncbi:MAG: AcrR family transcriptional regulator [Gammaproteobacteria bacterium]|jgi:AcrR family transcriptional regulator
MSGEQRRLEITRVTADLFAVHGFSVYTRRISEELGTSQAALYKHFKSKDAIIEEVFRVRYLQEKPSDFHLHLDTLPGSLLDRLTVAYVSFFSGITETSLKLFHRASYDGLGLAKRDSLHLNERRVWPVLEHLRAEVGLATLSDLPASRDERELALMLHSTIVLLGIRKFVYHIDFADNEPQGIRQYVSVWRAGAMAQYHARQGPQYHRFAKRWRRLSASRGGLTLRWRFVSHV